MAGVKLHELVIQQTLNGGIDQGHGRVIHISNSPEIPDRTKYLLGEIKDNPARALVCVMRSIEAAAEVLGCEAVVGIPCNTFHAPRIWNDFTRILKEGDVKVQVLHMLEETAEFIRENYPDMKNIGLMSTTGTRMVNVYGQILRPLGFNILEVPDGLQPELHDSIYNPSWGIKAVSPVTCKARGNFEKYAAILSDMGAEAIILGCTEIPLVLPEAKYKDTPFIDPMLALARALIRKTDPAKLKPLSK